MPDKTRKPSKSDRIQARIASQTRESLQDLPAKMELLSLQEAIHQLRAPLEAALSKGYSYQELAGILQQQGVSISTSALKNCLTSGRQQNSRATASNKLRAKSSKKPSETPSSTVEVFIPSKTDISSYTVRRDFWSAYQESLREREEVYRRLAES